MKKIDYIFSWYNTTKGEGFDEKFQGKSPNDFKYTSPFHCWDFLLKLRNNKQILVDVDGTIHNPQMNQYTVTEWNGKEAIIGDNVRFNDSQRPYQTDGLDAYVIKAYKNTIYDDMEVENVKTKEVCSLKQFLTQLEFMNLSEDEQRNVLKDTK